MRRKGALSLHQCGLLRVPTPRAVAPAREWPTLPAQKPQRLTTCVRSSRPAYRPRPDGIEILRVLNGARQIEHTCYLTTDARASTVAVACVIESKYALN